MIPHISEYIKFLLENNITPAQFLLLYLVETQDKNNIRQANVYFKDSDIDDLIEKKHLIIGENIPRTKETKNSKYILEELVVTLEFKEILLKNPRNAAKEVWDNYPPFQSIDNVLRPSRNIDFDDFVEKYQKIVGKDILEHLRIVRITKQVKEREKHAYFGIDKYISTRAYESYELKYAGSATTVQREVI
jgi:hypothetical protein